MTPFRIILPTILTLGLAHAALTEPNRVAFPTDLDALEHYTTVTRGEVTGFIYTSRAALEAIKAGAPAPPGTQVILQDWRDGQVYRLFIMQNGAGWGDDYAEASRAGDWQFQWYWPDGSINTDENTERCRACHQSREGSDYIFTHDDARGFE